MESGEIIGRGSPSSFHTLKNMTLNQNSSQGQGQSATDREDDSWHKIFANFYAHPQHAASTSISEAEWNCLYNYNYSEDSPDGQGQSSPGSESRHPWSWLVTPLDSKSRVKSPLLNFLWSPGQLGQSLFRSTRDFYGRIESSRQKLQTDSPAPNFSASSMDVGQNGDDANNNNREGEIMGLPGNLNATRVVTTLRSFNGQNSDNSDFQQWKTCNRTFDGLLCWPQTMEGFNASLPCFKSFRGIPYDESGTVTRLCMEGGIWQQQSTDYSQCIPKPHPTVDSTSVAGLTHDVYFAGYCLSLIALIIAMAIFIAFKELRCLRNKIHTHLIVTYIFADLLWIVTSIQYHLGNHQVSCITFILLHYFHLTNFFWMFVEGLYLYILVVKTFTAENVKLRLCAAIGWGVPLIVVIVWTVAKWLTHPLTTEFHRGDEETEFSTCFWLTLSIYDWIYKIPAIFVLGINSVFLLKIMWVLIIKLRSATNPETQQSRKAAKAMVILIPLLGITYVLVLRGSTQTPGYEIVRALLISTQGFLVALLYCFLNGEVRIAFRHRWNRLRDVCDPGLNICYCCLCSSSGSLSSSERRFSYWSPGSGSRSRTESIRLYTPTHTMSNYKKRGSSTSETTTMTTCLGSGSRSGSGGFGNGNSYSAVSYPNSNCGAQTVVVSTKSYDSSSTTETSCLL